MTARDRFNACRWPADGTGHYESWFARANDPSGERAFWIRYTIFAPRGRPEDAVGELWALVFEPSGISAAKRVVPASRCEFSRQGLDVRIDDATHDDDHVRGHATTDGRTIAWDLAIEGGQAPLLLLSPRLYEARLPRAKALVGRPLARFSGSLRIGDRTIEVDDWVGSGNHNWGSRHTDAYAWIQAAGFDEAPSAFLEGACARLRLGPIWSPWMSPVVLRLPERTLAFNSIVTAIRARGRYAPFELHIATGDRRTSLDIRVQAPAERFVALRYDNPPGGTKTCLNSKIARCRVRLEITGEPARILSTPRAAFEILTDDDDHGLTPVV